MWRLGVVNRGEVSSFFRVTGGGPDGGRYSKGVARLYGLAVVPARYSLTWTARRSPVKSGGDALLPFYSFACLPACLLLDGRGGFGTPEGGWGGRADGRTDGRLVHGAFRFYVIKDGRPVTEYGCDPLYLSCWQILCWGGDGCRDRAEGAVGAYPGSEMSLPCAVDACIQ